MGYQNGVSQNMYLVSPITRHLYFRVPLLFKKQLSIIWKSRDFNLWGIIMTWGIGTFRKHASWIPRSSWLMVKVEFSRYTKSRTSTYISCRLAVIPNITFKGVSKGRATLISRICSSSAVYQRESPSIQQRLQNQRYTNRIWWDGGTWQIRNFRIQAQRQQ
jgi:hypothetical protein